MFFTGNESSDPFSKSSLQMQSSLMSCDSFPDLSYSLQYTLLSVPAPFTSPVFTMISKSTFDTDTPICRIQRSTSHRLNCLSYERTLFISPSSFLFLLIFSYYFISIFLVHYKKISNRYVTLCKKCLYSEFF